MRVVFKTNLDIYQPVAWPVIENIKPSVGDYVRVWPASESYCNANKLPLELEVQSVVIAFDKIYCDLWYKKHDVEFADAARKKQLFGQ
jgi:hypothetical protein